jgi:hypothetical protein
MASCTFSVNWVIGILAFCIEVIAGAAYFYQYDHTAGHNGIHSGCTPKEAVGWWGCNNMAWYASYSLFGFGLISLLFAVAEIGLLLKPDWFAVVDSYVLRGIVYIIKGIATLGVSGDLGIAGGALELIIGAVELIFGILQKTGKLGGGGKK